MLTTASHGAQNSVVETRTFGTDPSFRLSRLPGSFRACKKPDLELTFKFSEHASAIDTLEGTVHCEKGDAVMTGVQGEHWPIKRSAFDKTYRVLHYDKDLNIGQATKKAAVVYVRQMSDNFDVKVSWSDDLLHGEPGDFLVEYGDNDFGTVKKSILPITYDVV